MNAALLLAWWNIIFIVPFLLALLYLAVYTTSGLTFGDDIALHAEADTDLHIEGDIAVNADADIDADADADADMDHDADAGDVDSGHDMPFHLLVLSWLGVGRVPLSILLMVLLITWSVVGFSVNTLLLPLMPVAGMVALFSLPVAAVSSLLLTRWIARFLGRIMPSFETYVQRKAELVGASGEAIYNIDDKFGMATVRDTRGGLFQVPCRIYEHREPIAKGSRILLVEYNEKESLYYVTHYEPAVQA